MHTFDFCTHVKDTLETHYVLIDWTDCDYHQDVVTLEVNAAQSEQLLNRPCLTSEI